MSIDSCKECGDYVDTDADPDCYWDIETEEVRDNCLCGGCRNE